LVDDAASQMQELKLSDLKKDKNDEEEKRKEMTKRLIKTKD
jgi:hypothetical protein